MTSQRVTKSTAKIILVGVTSETMEGLCKTYLHRFAPAGDRTTKDVGHMVTIKSAPK